MIWGSIVLLGIGYVTYLGIIQPGRTAQLLRVFSLDAAMQTDESRLDRLNVIADKYYQTRDFLSAEKAYLRVLKIDHRNFTAYYRLGLIYSYLNNNSDALECFELAAEIRPTATTLHNLGMTLFRYRDYKKAAEMLERANTKDESASRHVTLARIYRILDDNQRQLDHLLRAVELDRHNVSVLILLADAYLHVDNKTAADKVFAQVLRLDPNNSRAQAAIRHEEG